MRSWASAALVVVTIGTVVQVVLVLALVPAGGYLAVAAILSALYLVGVALALGVVGGGLGRTGGEDTGADRR